MPSLILRMVMVYLEEMASMLLRSGMSKKDVLAALAREVQKVPGVSKVNPDALREIVSNMAHQLGQFEFSMPVASIFKHLL